jgi:hypothetical protein
MSTRYQAAFGESFDKTNIRHVAQAIIETGQRLLALSDSAAQGESTAFDTYWALSGRYDSLASELRMEALCLDKIADNCANREFDSRVKSSSIVSGESLVHGDSDDFGSVLMPKEAAAMMPGFQQQPIRTISHTLGGSTREKAAAGPARKSSSRVLPAATNPAATRRVRATS